MSGEAVQPDIQALLHREGWRTYTLLNGKTTHVVFVEAVQNDRFVQRMQQLGIKVKNFGQYGQNHIVYNIGLE